MNGIDGRFQEICRQLSLYLHDRSGTNVADTVVELGKLQRVIYAFLEQEREHLSEIQKAQVFELGIRILVFITDRDSDQYQNFPPSYRNNLGPGNLYTEWRDAGEPGVLFRILGSLPPAARHSTRAHLDWLRDRLNLKGDRVWVLMYRHLLT